MISTRITADSWSLATYEATKPGRDLSQDGLLVQSRSSGVLRVAVFDGVTPIAATPSACGVNGSLWAAGVARTALSGPSHLDLCLIAANAALNGPVRLSRAQQQACVVAAYIAADGTLDLVRAGDCEVWVRTETAWRILFAPSHRDWAVAAWREYLNQHPDLWADAARRGEAEQEVWGREDAWESLPVGREAHLRFDRARLPSGSWSDLLLATDGLDSRAGGTARIDGFLAGANSVVREVGDDLAVIHVTPLGSQRNR